ncbi:MAG: hypothetical protein BYD32DRAFT_105080 [Podila humilis]|nr:MAG: hypothetical protein BYD32DRAFT_105080 [Podila humilis]
MPDKIQQVLNVLSRERLSLPEFLVEVFMSKNVAVKKWLSQFYRYKGPSRIIKIWSMKSRRKKWEKAFVDSAVDVVAERTRSHLANDVIKKPWRLPHTELTEQQIADLLHDDSRFLDQYADGAIYLSRLLKGVLGEDLPDQKPCDAQMRSSVRGCITAMLLYTASQKTNAFQTAMGIFLHSTGCPARVIEVLSGLGISSSPTHIQNCLKTLTEDARNRIQKAANENDFYIIYDNINFATKRHHQRTDNIDRFESGTTATLIIVPPNENTNEKPPKLTVLRPESERPKREVELFFPDQHDNIVLNDACKSLVSNAIVESLPEGSSVFAIPMKAIEPLNLHKTTAFPLRIMKIDESTISGNIAILEKVITEELQMPESWIANPPVTKWGGDQMTTSRLESAKIHRAIDPDPFHGLRWVQPVMQPFHLRMTLCGTIYKTHLGTQAFPGTLASIVVLLNRNRMSTDKPSFSDTDDLLRIVFQAKTQLLYEFLKKDGMSDKEEVSRVTDLITQSLLRINDKGRPLLPLGLPHTNANVNALLFLRDMAVYLELDACIKAGDIGRLRHLLPTITALLHGGGNRNYAIELLRLQYGLRQIWTDEWSKAVLSSMLVNPKGVDGGWMPADMFQENINYLIKAVFAAKGSNLKWDYLRDSVSTNVRTFQTVARMFECQVGVRTNSTKHKKPSALKDIAMIIDSLKNSGILALSVESKEEPPVHCTQRPLVNDLSQLGIDAMANGSIKAFLRNEKMKLEHAMDLENVLADENIME